MQQSPLQREGRLSTRHNAEEDSISHLAFPEGGPLKMAKTGPFLLIVVS